MPKVTYHDLKRVLIDPAVNTWYRLRFADIPNCGLTEDHLLYCKEISIPATTIDVITVEQKGFSIPFPGMHKTQNILSAEFYEPSSMELSTGLQKWKNLARDFDTQEQDPNYKAKIIIELYGIYDNPIKEYELTRVWPTDIAERRYVGDDGEMITLSVTFSFQHLTETQLS